MANSFSTINDTRTMEVGVDALKRGLTTMTAFSLDITPEPAFKGEVIQVPLFSSREGVAQGGDYQVGNTTVAGAQVTVSTHLKCSWHLEEETNMQTTAKLWEGMAAECGHGLALVVQNTIFNAITVANFGNTEGTDERTVTAANFDSDEIGDIKNICSKTLKWRPLQGNMLGSAIMDGAYITNAWKDPAIKDKSASGKDALESGLVGRVTGFDFFENNQLSQSTPGQGENLVGMFVQPGALATAVRPVLPLDDQAYLFQDIAVEPESGISASMRRWVDTQTGFMWGTFTVLMGTNVVDEARLLRIVSA